QIGIHLHLNAGDVDAIERGMIEDAAVAGTFRLELAAHLEVLVSLLGAEITVGLGHRLAENLAVLDRPLLCTVVLPATEILAVEERHPILGRAWRRSLRLGGRL